MLWRRVETGQRAGTLQTAPTGCRRRSRQTLAGRGSVDHLPQNTGVTLPGPDWVLKKSDNHEARRDESHPGEPPADAEPEGC